MPNEIQLLDLLTGNLAYLKSKKTLDDKCIVLLEALRKSGWGRVSLSFINSKFKTTKTLYSGYTEDETDFAEKTVIPPGKRRELMSATVERWRIGVFYYLPWREERARDIIGDGLRTDIPIELREIWNEHDMLYAPIYINTKPVAVVALDKPFNGEVPDKVNLRVATIIHCILIEVIQQYGIKENSPYYQQLQRCILDKGNVGVIEIDEWDHISAINGPVEIMLGLEATSCLNMPYTKVFNEDILLQLNEKFLASKQSLEIIQMSFDFSDKNKIKRSIRVSLFPVHILYSYRGMICIFDYPEESDIYKTYSNVLKKVDSMKAVMVGDARMIQSRLIKWLRDNYGFKYARIYQLSDNKEQLICKVFWDPDITDLAFFNHDYNRNSLPAAAMLERRILYTSLEKNQVRDIRRIWDALKTKSAIAIPLNLHENLQVVLVCDFDSKVFILDRAKETIFGFFAAVLTTTLKTLKQIENAKR